MSAPAASLRRRLPAAAPALAVAVVCVLAGCGSGKSATSATTTAAGTASAPATQPAQAPAAGALTAFSDCLARAHWRSGAAGRTDRAVAVMRAQPGYQTLVVMSDSHGDRVAVGFFGSTQQAEDAQVAVGEAVGGKGHASAAPGASVAWINYSGHTSVDQLVANCALAAHA